LCFTYYIIYYQIFSLEADLNKYYIYLLGYGYCKNNTAQKVREMLRLTVLKEVLKLVMYAGKRGEDNIIITPKSVLNAINSLRKATLKIQRTTKKLSDTQKEKTFHVVMVCPICHYNIKQYKKS